MGACGSVSSASAPAQTIGLRSRREQLLVNGRLVIEHILDLKMPVAACDCGLEVDVEQCHLSEPEVQCSTVILKGIAKGSLLEAALHKAKNCHDLVAGGGRHIMSVNGERGPQDIMEKLCNSSKIILVVRSGDSESCRAFRETKSWRSNGQSSSRSTSLGTASWQGKSPCSTMGSAATDAVDADSVAISKPMRDQQGPEVRLSSPAAFLSTASTKSGASVRLTL